MPISGYLPRPPDTKWIKNVMAISLLFTRYSVIPKIFLN